MPLRVYLAAAYRRRAELVQYREELRGQGIEATSRWLDVIREQDDGQSLRSYTPEECRRFASQDIDDICEADVCVSFTDGHLARGGRHVEFGLALGWGCRMLIVGPREHIFHHLPAVHHAATWGEALLTLVRWAMEKEQYGGLGSDDPTPPHAA